ncbi:MAG: caspase family protein [Fibromonadales bacterium]|nr:caspase family protein [Fibromonadales bacterium]
MKKVIFVFSLIFVAFLHAASQKVERFLLVAGANNGGSGKVLLRYAESDANSFANVMSQMGGIEKNNVLRVFGPDAVSMRKGFADMEKRLQSKNPNARKEVIVYYSGHADEQGLRLGRDIYSWADFRQSVHGLNADVKVAVIDACGSGAITRTKGGVSRPAFLQDASSEMKGYAFLTSSNENEVSQESDRLKGSFFTHSLVNGLRGAADMTGDGKVTLNEAYQFAFNETMRQTQSTSGGVQHPSRDMNLAGTGDVVMTDLRQVSSSLVLEKDMEGRFFIRDDKGNLVAELHKIGGRPLELGLPSGKYSVQMEAPSRLWRAGDIVLADGKKHVLSMNNMKNIDREIAVARGDADSALVDGLDSARKAPYSFNLNMYASSDKPASGTQFGLFVTDAKNAFVGSQVSLLANIARDDMAGAQINTIANVAAKKIYGAQIAVAANYATDIEGTQITTGFNIASNFKGVQAAFGPNIAVNGSGIQASPLNVLVDSLNGGQGGVINLANKVTMGQGGVINIAKDAGYAQGGVINIGGKMDYAQGGVINVAGNAGKLQGGVMNITGKTEYAQGGVMNLAGNAGYAQGGVINAAGKVEYIQGGVINAAGSVGKLQCGVINVGGHVGRQVGIINISAKSDYTPIGLINIVGNGIIDATFYVDETGRAGTTLHMGTPYLYTLFEYTLNPKLSGGWSEKFPQSWGWGLGTRFGMWSNFFSLDYSFSNTYAENPGSFQTASVNKNDPGNYLQKVRLGGAYKLLPGLALSSGLTMNALSEGYGDGLHVEPRGGYHWHWTFGDNKVRLWPGLYAGLTVGKF